MNWLRDCFRGCGKLPYVGEHPGTRVMGLFTAIGALAGSTNQGSLMASLVGAVVMWIGLGPMYFFGAWRRCKLSDRLNDQRKSI